MSALSIRPAPPTPCPRLSMQHVAYRTIGRPHYATHPSVRLTIMTRVHPTLDLGAFVNTADLSADLDLATFGVLVEPQDSLHHIGNIVAQHLTRKAVRYAIAADAQCRLPPILVPRSALLFAVRAWPGENEALLLPDGILVEDMLVLQDWGTTEGEISGPGDLTLYCVLAAVRVLVAGECA